MRGLRAWSGFRQTGLTYERHARAAGEAKYDFKKLRRLAMDGIVSFSTVPLSIASHLGLWISVLSFFGIVFTLFQRIFKSFFESIGVGPVPGFAQVLDLRYGIRNLLYIGFTDPARRPVILVVSSSGTATGQSNDQHEYDDPQTRDRPLFT